MVGLEGVDHHLDVSRLDVVHASCNGHFSFVDQPCKDGAFLGQSLTHEGHVLGGAGVQIGRVRLRADARLRVGHGRLDGGKKVGDVAVFDAVPSGSDCTARGVAQDEGL